MKTEWVRSKVANIFFLLFILLFIGDLTSQAIIRGDGQYVDDALYLFAIISLILPLVYLVMQVQLLVREFAEKRVRLQYLLPLAINKISYTRLLTPLFLLIAFSLVAGYLLIIQSRIMLSDPVLRYGVITLEELKVLFCVIPITYGIRLFSERIGTILGIVFCGILITTSIYIETYPFTYLSGAFKPFGFMVMSVIFVLLIHILFMTRRSFLK
jgi:hypothetical protein